MFTLALKQGSLKLESIERDEMMDRLVTVFNFLREKVNTAA